MISQKELVPKRRFEGFYDEWKKSTLGELGSVAMNKRIFKDQTTENGEVPFFKIGTFGKKPDAFISRKLFEEYKFNYEYPEIGDVLISASGSIGRTVEYKGEDEYFQDSNIVWLKHQGQIDNIFLKQFYSIVKWEGLEGSTIKRLYNSNILNTKIIIPTLIEQQKIGQFFKHLDEMITLEQRKIDKTKALKSAFLAEMFPAEGEHVPKRRFAGFTDDWKLLKLKDLIVSEEKGRARAEMIGNESTYLDARYLNGGEKLTVDSPSNVNQDDVLILWDGSHAGKVYHGFKGALGSTLKALQPVESGSFIYYYLFFNEKEIFEQYRTPNIPHVINTFTDEFMISKPNLDEQLKIGDFFKKIDGIITNNQQKIEKLKVTKQAYLNEMFM